MAHPNISRVFSKLGFFYIDEKHDRVLVGHLREYMIEAITLDEYGAVAEGPYADLVRKAITALELYDAKADQAVYGNPAMRESFFELIAEESGLAPEVVSILTR
ncbi:hypothetical protein ACCD08_04435 [Telluria sp. Tellsp104]